MRVCVGGNTSPYGTEANAAGRSGRACLLRSRPVNLGAELNPGPLIRQDPGSCGVTLLLGFPFQFSKDGACKCRWGDGFPDPETRRRDSARVREAQRTRTLAAISTSL